LTEIFDLSLYGALHAITPPDLRTTLEALILADAAWSRR
jgi:hypothetical protein